MQIGSVTSAPNVYGTRQPQRIHGIAPVARINPDFAEQDPLDHLTISDRALLAHLQSGVIDLDASAGTAVAVLAREIAHVRAEGLVPGGRPLTDEEVRWLVRRSVAAAVRPASPQVHARMAVHLAPGEGRHVDVLL